MAIYAAFSLEWLRIKRVIAYLQRMNPFALRSKLYLKAIRQAFEELQHLKYCVTSSLGTNRVLPCKTVS